MIKLEHVTKTYPRNNALDDFSLTISEPGIYVLLGRNGAGKTTLLRTIAGHIAPTSGVVEVAGQPVTRLAMPHSVHFVAADARQFNMRLVDLFAAAEAINPGFDQDLALRIAGEFELDTHKRYNQLSFGMKAMANTLIAVASGKQTILLDEPVLGFDPVMRKVFYEMLAEVSVGKTVVVSTHIMDEISRVAGHLIIIDHGRLLLSSDMNDLDEHAYCITGPAGAVRAATEGLRVIGETPVAGFLSQYVYDARVAESEAYSLSALSLQDFFIALVGEGTEL